MSAKILYRVAAVILVLFAAGHTFGFLGFKPPSQEGLAVRDAMNNVRFTVGNKNYTYAGFYKGFGLYITVYLLFSALLAWHVGNLAATRPDAIGLHGWSFLGVQIACAVLSWLYFFPIAAV